MVEREDRLSGRRSTSTDPDIRSDFERDVDRIFYSYYFRRLSEITQVSSGDDRILRHNRMTHSLKVAQVGRRLVQYLHNDDENKVGIDATGGIDRNVVFAAGLLHDTGHPPFGHVGEHQLNRIAHARHLADGFEGNAQTLRILLSLTEHQRDEQLVDGLDLTRAVIAACVKYPWSHAEAEGFGKPAKWGYYETESTLFSKFVAPALPDRPGTPTLEAEIMDWADDITYAVHDLQDFYTDGIIPLHHLRYHNGGPVHQREFAEFWEYVTEKLRRVGSQPTPEAREEFEKYAASFPESRFKQTRAEAGKVGALASRIITNASKATAVTTDGRLFVEPSMKSVIGALKQVTWFYVIDHPNLVSTQIGQRARINQVFNKLYKRVQFSYRRRVDDRLITPNEQWTYKRRLPAPLREFTELLLAARRGRGAYETAEQCYVRAVIDYIASMTEVEFGRLQQRLCPVENYDTVDDSDFYRGDEGV